MRIAATLLIVGQVFAPQAARAARPQANPYSAEALPLMGRFFDGARTNLSGQGFLLGSFDSDSAADVMRGGNTELTLFTATPEGFLVSDGALPISEPFSPSAVANMNGDGIPDLVGSTPSGFGTLRGMPGGFEVTPVHPSGAPASWDAIGDVDGDGLADLVAREGDVVAIYFNRGDAFLKVASVVGATFGGMAVADIDGDGDGEVITFGYSSPYSSTLLVLRLTAPAGALEKWKEIAVDGAGELLPADFDGDGAIDIAAGGSTQVTLFWNSGTGDLDPIVVGSSTGETADMTAEDINGDQRLDLLCLFSIPVRRIRAGPGLDQSGQSAVRSRLQQFRRRLTRGRECDGSRRRRP